MKNKLAAIAIAFIVLTVVLNSCKKNQPFTGAKVYQKIDFRQRTTSTYTYNEDGTIAKIVSTTGSDTVFTYVGDTVMETDNGNTGQASSGYFFFKNSSGYADSVKGIYSQSAYSYAYSYDSYDMLSQAKIYIKNGNAPVLHTTYDFTNSGKNIYKIITTDNTSGQLTYDYFTFFSSNSNTVGVQDVGKYHLGASATSPLQSDININNNLDTVYTIKYRYAYDGSGRIDTVVSYKTLHGALNGSQIDSIAYSYYD